MNQHKTNPVKAIREYCVDCCGGDRKAVTDCAAKETCNLWEFRMGKNPYRAKKELTPEQREAAAQRLQNVRKAKANEQ